MVRNLKKHKSMLKQKTILLPEYFLKSSLVTMIPIGKSVPKDPIVSKSIAGKNVPMSPFCRPIKAPKIQRNITGNMTKPNILQSAYEVFKDS